ncbi:hypothetical protein PQI64_14960 [Shewanella bicestrii]
MSFSNLSANREYLLTSLYLRLSIHRYWLSGDILDAFIEIFPRCLAGRVT